MSPETELFYLRSNAYGCIYKLLAADLPSSEIGYTSLLAVSAFFQSAISCGKVLATVMTKGRRFCPSSANDGTWVSSNNFRFKIDLNYF